MFSKHSLDEEKEKTAKRLKACSYNYLEHKIRQEYGGSLVTRVDDDSLSTTFTKNEPSTSGIGSSKSTESRKQTTIKGGNEVLFNTADRDDTNCFEPGTSSSDFKVDRKQSSQHDSETDSDEDSEEADDGESGNSDISLSDLETLLNEGLPERYKAVPEDVQEKLKNKKQNYEEDFRETKRTTLEELGNDPFDILPDGWYKIIHEIGVPVFLYRKTRCVSLSPPNVLNFADRYTMKLPVSSIPCLHYRRQKEKLQSIGSDCVKHINNVAFPIVKVISVEDYQKTRFLSHEEVWEYYHGSLPFKPNLNAISKKEDLPDSKKETYLYPSMSEGTKLLSFPIVERDGKGNIISRKDWIINPRDKGFIALLHDFSQQAIRHPPVYDMYEVKESSQYSYKSVILLSGEQFGEGYGKNKREAKIMAAKNTLEMIIPELKGQLEEICKSEKPVPLYHPTLVNSERNVFDNLKLNNVRAIEFLAKTSEPSPYAMLMTCLKRNYGSCNVMIKYDVINKHKLFNKYTMIVKPHKITVNCKNKTDGKQKAAQAMLQILHPHLNNWGALIRLYGSKSMKNNKDKKQVEREITSLQRCAIENQPNYAVLDKLYGELQRLNLQKNNRKPLPPFVEEDIPKFED